MAYAVYPQKNEVQEIVGYMRVFRGPNGKYRYKGREVEDHEVVRSDDPAVVDFLAEKNRPPLKRPTLDEKLAALEARIAVLEAAKAAEAVK